MPDFSKRSLDAEIMDDLHCSGEVVYQTLRELETINYLLGGNYVTLDGVAQLLSSESFERPVSITDLGCGSGDILKLIRNWTTKKKYKLHCLGIDANPNIVAYAQAHTLGYPIIQYETLNIFSEEFRQRKFDILIGTLFFHHFSSEQLVSFFNQVKNQVRVGMVINDIHRHGFAYYAIKGLTKLLSKSAMVKYDAPLSVLRAFRKGELIDIMKKAGIENYTIRWMWAFRWQVIITTPSS